VEVVDVLVVETITSEQKAGSKSHDISQWVTSLEVPAVVRRLVALLCGTPKGLEVLLHWALSIIIGSLTLGSVHDLDETSLGVLLWWVSVVVTTGCCC
jgi:hypothetical protein